MAKSAVDIDIWEATMHLANNLGFMKRWQFPAVMFAALIALCVILVVPFVLDDQVGMTQRSSEDSRIPLAMDDNIAPVVSAEAVQLRARHVHSRRASFDRDTEAGPMVHADAIQFRARNLHGETLPASDLYPSATGKLESN